MAGALHHRGPDATAYTEIRTARQTVWLAHNRLRITDLRPQADQLFQSPDARHSLVFNGAIYNYQELRTALANKYAFRTDTDTEVLLYWLMEHGEGGLAQLNGMFAFAWYDQREEKLRLCRDRFGMKPLYYAENAQYLIVSSEIRGIFASGLLPKVLNESQLAHCFCFKFARRPQTFFREVYELLPGKCYMATPAHPLTEGASFAVSDPATSDPVSLATIGDLLRNAVARQVNAQVPVGLMLSGGVDSTLLLAICREIGVRHLPVFTIAQPATDVSFGTRDYQFARRAAQQYEAEYHEVLITENILDEFDTFLQTVDQPIGDGAAWLSWLLAKAAQPYVKVVLSGAGADELFAGYHRHWAYYQYLRHYHSWMRVLPFLRTTAPLIPSGFDHPFRKQLRLLRKLSMQLHPSPEQTFTNFTAQAVAIQPDSVNRQAKLTSDPDPEFYLRKALHYDQENFLSADVLALTDRATMQAGIEARLPYLDNQLVSVANALPAAYLLQNGKKWLLKELLKGKGGGAYANRRKEGFGMPFGKWIKAEKADFLVNLLKNEDCIMYRVLSYEEVSRMLRMHISGKVDYSSELWTAALLAAWIEKEFGVHYH